MNKKQLFKEIGLIDDDLIEGAASLKRRVIRNHSYAKWVAVAAVVCIFISSITTTLAVNYIQKGNLDFYIRYLSPENINLENNTDVIENADKFFEALKSDNVYYQYIAINRLVECFNDSKLKVKALNQIEPFVQSNEKKLAEAASFAIDILSETYKSDKIYKLADGSIVFTLFHNYSDYGDYNEIWRIKQEKLEKYFSFSKPSLYIREMKLSPDRGLLAVTTCSNKSDFMIVLDPIKGMVSPDLISSSRMIFGARKEYPVFVRIDNENYSGVTNVSWKNNRVISFDASLPYNDMEIIENVSVQYDVDKRSFNIELTK